MAAPHRTARALTWLVAGLAAFGAAGCGDRPPRPRLVLLISLDTVRRDALDLYRAGGGDTTPALDAFAKEAVVFRNHGVQVPFTLPSHMSMFTGVYPGVHGVNTASERLDPRLETLPEVLHEAGWATHGVVTNLWMKGDFGFARGFDGYERLEPGLTYAERVDARALELLDAARTSDAPRFLFLHYMDAHSDFDRDTGEDLPYHASPAFRREHEAGPPFQLPDGRRATAFLEAANKGEVTLDAAAERRLRGLYDDGVRELDHELGRLFDALRERGLYDESLIVITSDHGEEFGEHGRFLHEQPFEECVAAPLLMRFPGARWAGRDVDALSESVDLMPTLLDAVGLKAPGSVQGASLMPQIEGAAAGQRTILSRDKRIASRYALRQGRWKLVWDFATDRGALFDLERDPLEQHDLAATEPDRTRALRDRLETQARRNDTLGRLLAGHAGATGQVLDDEEMRVLRSLGYFSDESTDAERR